MIDELAVRNLGVLDASDVELAPGLVAITGETGAGKTLLLGAIRLLTGRRADPQIVGPSGEEATVEARLLVDGDEHVASRRVGGGKSRAYFDGSMVPAKVLEERVGPLVDIVAQDERMRIANSETLRRLVDPHLAPQVLAAFDEARAEYERLRGDLQAIGGDRRVLERRQDLLAYQVGEIRRAGFAPGDEERLQVDVSRLRNAEEIVEILGLAHQSLETARDAAGSALDLLRRAGRLDPTIGHRTAADAAALLAEVLGEVRAWMEGISHDPDLLEATERRIAELRDLQRKYGASVAEVLEFAENAQTELTRLESLLEHADELDGAIAAATRRLEEAGTARREARLAAARRIAATAREHLDALGLGRAVLEIDVAGPTSYTDGDDVFSLRFASDKRLGEGDARKLASGGELSRLVLALRLAGGRPDVPILVFDEIDAGIGGETALALGRKLAALSAGRQVLCVTHLPQVAAFADVHLVVRRSGAHAWVERIERDARTEELSRMLAGLPDSDPGREHAIELLNLAGKG